MELFVVTGASSGLGEKLAFELAKIERARVVGLVRDPDKIKSNPDNIQYQKCDLLDPVQINEAIDNVCTNNFHCSRVILVLNAGYGQYGPVSKLSSEKVIDQFQVNVFANQQLIKEFNEAFNCPVDVVAISSIYGLTSQINKGVYSASKQALEALVEAYGLESGNRTMVVRPAGIKTNYLNNALKRHDLEHNPEYHNYMESASLFGFSEPGYVADKVVRAMNKPSWSEILKVSTPAKAFHLLISGTPNSLKRKVLRKLYQKEIDNVKRG